MAELFREVFVEELEKNGGYPVVDAPAENVLLLRPSIIDLDVAAPDLGLAENVYTLTATAGVATLYIELYDSVSGAILARIIDRQAATNTNNTLRYANKFTNREAATKMLSDWAGLLRDGMDDIHATAPPSADKE